MGVQDIPEVTGCAHLGTSCTCSDLPCKSLSDITTSAGMLTETRSTLVSSDGISSRHRELFEGVRLEPLEEGMRKDSVPRVDDNMEAWEKGSCDGTRSSILEEADPWSTPSMLDPCWTEPAPRGLEIVARCGPGCALPDSRGTLDGAALRSDRTPSPERLHAAAEGSFDHRDSIIANLISQTADMHAQLLQAQDQVLGVGARAGGQTSIAPHLSPASGEDPVSRVTAAAAASEDRNTIDVTASGRLRNLSQGLRAARVLSILGLDMTVLLSPPCRFDHPCHDSNGI